MFLFLSANISIYLQVWMLNEISEECWNLSVNLSLAAIDAQSKRLPGWRGFWPIEAGEGLTRVRAHLLLLTHQPWLSTLLLSLRCLQGCLHPCAAPLWALPLSARMSPSLHPWHRIFSLLFCWSSTVLLSAAEVLLPVFGWVGLMLRFPCFLTLGGVKTKANIPPPA